MKIKFVIMVAVVFFANIAEAKPQKYGYKGNNSQAEQTQEIAVNAEENIEGNDLEKIEPAAGDIKEEINKGSTLNRQFKNR